MLQIIGYNIPDNKKLYISLSYIYGIGKYTAKKICKDCQIDENIRAHEISPEQIQMLSKHIRDGYSTGIDLKKQIILNVKKLVEMNCYRGIRVKLNLPRNGQRTKSNSKTVRKLKAFNLN